MHHSFFSRFWRRQPFLHIFIDSALTVISLFLSLWLRLGWTDLYQHIDALYLFTPIFVALRILTFMGSSVYFAIWRYISTFDAWVLFRAVGVSTLLFFAASYILPQFGRLPRSVFFIDMILATAFHMGVRLFRRHSFESKSKQSSKSTFPGKRTLIYGAGDNGRHLAQRISSDPSLGLDLFGFIDDDPKKKERHISGLKVLGQFADLEGLLKISGAEELIVAIKKPSGDFMRKLIVLTRSFGIQPQLITNLTQLGGERNNLSLFRELNLSDLLNRGISDIDLDSVFNLISGKTVLVTGAGGSIGSELSRQIHRFNPKTLLLLDHSEFNLYEIDKELRLSTNDSQRVLPILVDVKNSETLELVFKEHSPELVFHAAAYKHVHLVEANPYSAILNNILGTSNILSMANKYDVSNFVLVSTDKAVNPAGTMGKTKRICELMTSSLGIKTKKSYCSVRFGNVLGSSGSLIPLLQKQIAEGGPVTVTHKDMTRYFMLIPEAASLVLLAATSSTPGDISVLKMGHPVKIIDVAKSLISMMGKTTDEIPIVFTGIRPGEKMFEELYLSGKEIQTDHPDILVIPDGDSGSPKNTEEIRQLFIAIDEMVELASNGDKEAVYLLNNLVKNGIKGIEKYKPNSTDQRPQNH